MAGIIYMDEDIKIEDNAESLPPPDEIESPIPSQDQENLWRNINDLTNANTLLREAKFIRVGGATRKKLSSIGLASRIELLSSAHELTENEGRALALLIGRFAIHDLTLTLFTQELTKLLGAERGNTLMTTESLRGILQSFAPDAVLFSDQTPADAARLSRPMPAPSVAIPKPAAPPASAPAQTIKPSVAETETQENAAPFILHEETSAFTPPTPKIQSSVSFDILRAPRSAPAPKPISVKIESPFEKPKGAEPRRVVHYSNLRTPIDDKSH